jgi:hypothetical protein
MKRIWRISADKPMGGFVEAADRKKRPVAAPAPEVTSGGWVESSFELLRGADVEEVSDTIPADLLDLLFSDPKKSK